MARDLKPWDPYYYCCHCRLLHPTQFPTRRTPMTWKRDIPSPTEGERPRRCGNSVPLYGPGGEYTVAFGLIRQATENLQLPRNPKTATPIDVFEYNSNAVSSGSPSAWSQQWGASLEGVERYGKISRLVRLKHTLTLDWNRDSREDDVASIFSMEMTVCEGSPYSLCSHCKLGDSKLLDKLKQLVRCEYHWSELASKHTNHDSAATPPTQPILDQCFICKRVSGMTVSMKKNSPQPSEETDLQTSDDGIVCIQPIQNLVVTITTEVELGRGVGEPARDHLWALFTKTEEEASLELERLEPTLSMSERLVEPMIATGGRRSLQLLQRMFNA